MQQQRAAAVSQKFCQPVGTHVFTLEMKGPSPSLLRGGRCEEDAEKASKSHEKTSEDPTTFTLASSEWVYFPLSYEVLFTFLKEPTSPSLPRPNRDQKADGEAPSLPPARRRRPGPRALGGGRHIRRQNC